MTMIAALPPPRQPRSDHQELGVSKSSASVAARLLESYTLSSRHRAPGTKSALYAVADDYEAMIRQQSHLLDALAELNAGSGINASLQEMAEILPGDAPRYV